MNTAEDLYLFETADEALSFAFAMEAKRVYSQGLSEGTGGENMYDRIAEGMMIKSRCLRVAGYMGQKVIIALYTIPNQDLIDKKKEAIETLGKWVHSKTKRPLHCLTDGVRDWAISSPIHDQVWWARHLDKAPRTIFRYWKSKDPKDESVKFLLNAALEKALIRITDDLRFEGIIP